jgi:signal transduction histidine kinase
MDLSTLAGRHIEAEGRAIGGRAVVRLKEVTGARRALAELTLAHQRLLADVDTLRTLLETVPLPIWARDAGGKLVWVNPAYARAVEAQDAADAIGRGQELLERSARDDLLRAREHGQSYTARLPVIVAGERRVFDVLDLPAREGSAGIGIDATEVETMQAKLAHMVDAHRRTLDQLPTAVAIFGADQRLTFCNAAYRALWTLDSTFLDQEPSDAAVLDQLRAARKLPEQADFRQWRNQLHEAYRALEPKEHWWHLPDGRTLRVVAAPNPEGGVTYVFDDVTERLDLERRHDALLRVQGETLDHLAEGVAVFGSDGRLRLNNPAFARLWKLSQTLLSDHPHIETVIDWCRLQGDSALWQALRSAVTGLDRRETVTGRIERKDGSVLDCATVPLPDGGTLVTFEDVTDTVNVERALRERNEALEAADELKNDFVHHVSYELRTPLTNIIGFAHLLHDDATGPLSDKQREYLGYISSSSAALLAIINDILDLASIDAGAMKLDLGPVDIRGTIEAAAEGVQDRLKEHALTLDIRAADGIGNFTADERRIRQILFNLLSNAVVFSSSGGTITLTAERRPDAIVFSVVDRGRGIPRDILDRVFNRFESHGLGSQHRGAGLGLSIVRSFVELHGGVVKLESMEGRGTTVTCVFPLEQKARRVAAE